MLVVKGKRQERELRRWAVVSSLLFGAHRPRRGAQISVGGLCIGERTTSCREMNAVAGKEFFEYTSLQFFCGHIGRELP